MFDVYPDCTNCLNTYLKRDIVFVVDGSASVTQENFDIQLDFIQRVGDRMGLGLNAGETRIAMVQFTVGDGDARTEFLFQDSSDGLQAKLDNVTYMSGFTVTGAAIEHAYVDVIRYHTRPDAQVTMITMTDGRSFDSVKIQGRQIQATGVEMYSS